MSISISNLTVANNVPPGTTIGILNAHDASGTVVPCNYTLTKGSIGYFAIASNNLVSTWTTPATPGHYSVRIHAIASSTKFSGSATFTVNIVPPSPPPPAPQPPPPSPDGSTIQAGSSGSLQTVDGTWSFGAPLAQYPGNWAILLDGLSAAGGGGSELEVANGGHMYALGVGLNWYIWQSGSWALTGNPNPPPPPTPTPLISFNPPNPAIPAMTPKGAVVAGIVVTMSDGSPFAGTLGFGPPNYDDGGAFAISGSNLIINPNGPGVSSDGSTIQNCTVIANQ